MGKVIELSQVGGLNHRYERRVAWPAEVDSIALAPRCRSSGPIAPTPGAIAPPTKSILNIRYTTTGFTRGAMGFRGGTRHETAPNWTRWGSDKAQW